jgi:hypothetical protein
VTVTLTDEQNLSDMLPLGVPLRELDRDLAGRSDLPRK